MHIFAEKKSFNAQACLWTEQGVPAPVYVFGQVSSVLDAAWELVAQSALPEWGSVLAESQSMGRGQMRRHWHSPAGNVYAALRLPMQEPFATTAAAPALSAYIIKALRSLHCSLHLKWPNDLVHQISPTHAEKVGGILLEERDGVLLAGIGLNAAHAPKDDALRENYALSAGILPETVDINKHITLQNNDLFCHKNATTEPLWIYVVNRLYFCYENQLPLATATVTAATTWLEEAHNVLLWKGKYVNLEDGRENIRGILQGLNTQGQLCILVEGKKQYFTSGSLRLA